MLEDKAFVYQYRSDTTAIHIYDYVAQIRIGPHQFELLPGDMTITPSNTSSYYDLPRPGHHVCMHFYAPTLQADEPTIQLPLHLRLGSLRRHAEQNIMECGRLLARGLAGDPVATPAAESTLQRLLLDLASFAASAGSPRHTRTELAADLVAAIIASRFAEDLTVPSLALEVGISQNYLARHFHRRYGSTIPHFLIHCRIDYARQLLRDTDMPIHVVARRCGIDDPQYFNKQFRRLTGISPTRWRDESRHKADTRSR